MLCVNKSHTRQHTRINCCCNTPKEYEKNVITISFRIRSDIEYPPSIFTPKIPFVLRRPSTQRMCVFSKKRTRQLAPPPPCDTGFLEDRLWRHPVFTTNVSFRFNYGPACPQTRFLRRHDDGVEILRRLVFCSSFFWPGAGAPIKTQERQMSNRRPFRNRTPRTVLIIG